MIHRSKIIVFMFFLIAGSAAAVTIEYKDHPKVNELEAIYAKYIDAMSRGDVSAYFQTEPKM